DLRNQNRFLAFDDLSPSGLERSHERDASRVLELRNVLDAAPLQCLQQSRSDDHVMTGAYVRFDLRHDLGIVCGMRREQHARLVYGEGGDHLDRDTDHAEIRFEKILARRMEGAIAMQS